METITLPRKEFDKLVKTRDKVGALRFWLPARNGKRGKFIDAAFGVFKKEFGKKSSAFYISKMRKAWRT